MMKKTNKNKNLNSAKQSKNDEFYTMYEDIEKEMLNYSSDLFNDKIVYCNCDDYRRSNFVRYFINNFNDLGLKQLIATHFLPSKSDIMELDSLAFDVEKPMKLIVSKINNELRQVVDPMRGDGDFRSAECVVLLKQADIVVTNPPFSLFREFFGQLIDYKKEFLILGNMNAITYLGVFPSIKENKVWLGVSQRGINFILPSNQIKNVNAVWFTNLQHNKQNPPIDLVKKYTPEEYLTYDNYDAIDVIKTKYIPHDYNGVMGVPISFLDKYNPDQFEIVGSTNGEYINKILTYKRIFIKRKTTC